MAPSSGTGSIGGRLRERRSSRIKSSSAVRELVELWPGTTAAGSFRPNDSAPTEPGAILAGVSAPNTAANWKQMKQKRILTSGALSSLTCVHHTTIRLKDSPTFERRRAEVAMMASVILGLHRPRD